MIARAKPGAVRLQDVVEQIDRAGLLIARPAADAMIAGVTDDSRRVVQGDLFCAWEGASVDAHAFVPDVAEQGAAAALVEHETPAALPQVVVADGRRAASVGASVVLGWPQDGLQMAGVTGTNGKTTTVWILRHLLGLRHAAASIGTLGVILEDGRPLEGSESLTTPGPVEMIRILHGLVDRGVGAVAMEVSSHALEQGRVHALGFDAAVFTNLTHDHLDYHGTEAAYRAAKLSLIDRIRENGWAVINAADAAWRDVPLRAARVLSFGLGAGADLHAAGLVLDEHGARFDCNFRGRRVAVDLPLPGGFNVENALGAMGACLALGFDLEALALRLRDVPQVPGRLERIADRPCAIFRDYAHTPDALERVLLTLRPLTRGRLIVLFGAGGDRDRRKRPVMGRVVDAHADVAIVTSDNPRTEDPEKIIDEISAAMARPHVRITDRRAAIAHALEVALPDDVVLLAGKGHETYQVLGTGRVPFDERVIVAQMLATRGLRP
jgi:UDP-N-acetylmuramoyl-L-alanyl-D-glutamate--2,6-diaminopimelate ligase